MLGWMICVLTTRDFAYALYVHASRREPPPRSVVRLWKIKRTVEKDSKKSAH